MDWKMKFFQRLLVINKVATSHLMSRDVVGTTLLVEEIHHKIKSEVATTTSSSSPSSSSASSSTSLKRLLTSFTKHWKH